MLYRNEIRFCCQINYFKKHQIFRNFCILELCQISYEKNFKFSETFKLQRVYWWDIPLLNPDTNEKIWCIQEMLALDWIFFSNTVWSLGVKKCELWNNHYLAQIICQPFRWITVWIPRTEDQRNGCFQKLIVSKPPDTELGVAQRRVFF